MSTATEPTPVPESARPAQQAKDSTVDKKEVVKKNPSTTTTTTKTASSPKSKADDPASRGRAGSRLPPKNQRSRSASQGSRASSKKATTDKTRATSMRVPDKKQSGSVRKDATLGEFLASSGNAPGGPRSNSKSNVVRKTLSFKKIRGMFSKSESSKSRRDSKQTSKSATSRKSSKELKELRRGASTEDDASTVNVNVDDRSVANSTVASSKLADAKEAYLLRMVLLLMDVDSRRFELLQLEFDSEKALVSDVLAQIPVSVTEESLRDQSYETIVTTDGEEKVSGKRLSEFCKSNDVLVAVPKVLSAKEAHRLSKPILSNTKVVGMLKSSGVNTQALQTSRDVLGPEKKEVESDTDKNDKAMSDWTSRQIAADKITKKPTQTGGSKLFAAIVVAMAAVVASFVHKYITTPIQPGHVVAPGIVLSKCGLNFFSRCEPAYLEVQSGIVSYYEGKELAWVIHGRVCREDEIKNKACLDGLEFKQDRTLWIGGEPIKWMEKYTESGQKSTSADQLVPWPFYEEPKIKSWEIAATKVKSGAANIADDAMKAGRRIKDDAIHLAGDAKKAASYIKDEAANLADDAKKAAGKIKENAQQAAERVIDETTDRIKKTTSMIKESQIFTKTND